MGSEKKAMGHRWLQIVNMKEVKPQTDRHGYIKNISIKKEKSVI